jgi:hypothetical protein
MKLNKESKFILCDFQYSQFSIHNIFNCTNIIELHTVFFKFIYIHNAIFHTLIGSHWLSLALIGSQYLIFLSARYKQPLLSF